MFCLFSKEYRRLEKEAKKIKLRQEYVKKIYNSELYRIDKESLIKSFNNLEPDEKDISKLSKNYPDYCFIYDLDDNIIEIKDA